MIFRFERKKYTPVGHCIYCGETPATAGILGDEHIIPRAIGGNHILPKASCRKCERVTSGIETELSKTLFKQARAHFEIKGRKSKGPARNIRNSAGKVYRSSEYPLGLHLFLLWPPKLLIKPGSSLEGMPSDKVHLEMIALSGNFNDRLHRVGVGEFIVPARPDSFARLLAKIAHAYAVAELGAFRFFPLLPDMILGKSNKNIYDYVGGDITERPIRRTIKDKTEFVHHMEIIYKFIGKIMHVIVKIRLFPNYGGFTYYIVTGEILK